MLSVDEIRLDVTKDSVSSMMQKLMMKAYRGKPPEGGREVPAATMLGASPEYAADYTVTAHMDPVAKEISADPYLVPPIMKHEPIPKQSEQPFNSPFQDTAPVGLFGKALQSHSKLVSAMEAIGQPTAEIERIFKASWGIEANTDLQTFYSRPRSTGSAMFGGINRKPVPAVLTMSNAQGKVDVIDHGKTRSEIGEDVLVDWPRAKATAMAIGVQLVADDDVYKKEARPLHFRLVRSELPHAPKIVIPPDLPEVKSEKVEIAKEAIVKLSAAMRKLNNVKGHKFNNMEAEDLAPNNVIQAIRAIPTGYSIKTNDRLMEQVVDFDYYKAFEERQPLTFADTKAIRDLRPVDIIQSFAMAYADQQKGGVPRVKEIQMMIVNLDHDYQTAYAWLNRICRIAIPQDILIRTFWLGNFVGESSGIKWVNDLRKYLGCKDSIFSERDLVKAWKESLTDVRFLKRLAEEISIGYSKYERIAIKNPKITRGIQRKLAHAETLVHGLSELIHNHSVYWHNRYRHKLCKDNKDRVMNQVMAKFLRNVKLRLFKDMTLAIDKQRMMDILKETYWAYMKKRTKKDVDPVTYEPPYYKNYDVLDYAAALDDIVIKVIGKLPEVSYYDLAKEGLDMCELFMNDIRDLIERVFNYKETELPETYFKDKFEDFHDDIYKSFDDPVPLPEAIPVAITIPINKQEVKPESQTVKGSDEKPVGMMFNYVAPIVSQEVDLREELAEEGIKVNSKIVVTILSKYPRMVHFREVEKIKKEILAATYNVNKN